jgi:hypothetical protein
MNATRYYVRDAATRLYWDGLGFCSRQPAVSVDAAGLEALKARRSFIEPVKIVPAIPADVREAYNRLMDVDRGPIDSGYYDRTRSQNIKIGVRRNRLFRLMEKHGLNEAETLYQLVNPSIFAEAV